MSYDLLIIGGGVNGAAIARDAAGRGLKTLLVERDDLASHTSSHSSKLVHGGVRYLEYYEFGLVRKALKEREVMLRSAPHIIWPMRFVFPHNDIVRPLWMIRAGMLLYDMLAIGGSLMRHKKLGKANPRYRSPLKNPEIRGFAYSDCWVDDARLVALNAVDAAARGAEIATRTELVSAERSGPVWSAMLGDGRTVEARAMVNATGPWVSEVMGQRMGISGEAGVRLVRGSHIVVPRLFIGDHAYIFQLPDRRIVFALPWLERYTLLGTTDVPVNEPGDDSISEDEIGYLCDAANFYFAARVGPENVVHSYAGVRSLYDDGASEAAEVTRDYVLELDGGGETSSPPLLSVFGGKITTARMLAEEAVDRLCVATPFSGSAWTHDAILPGGEFGGDFDAFVAAIETDYPWLGWAEAQRMGHAYGSRITEILGDARGLGELGEHFGGGLTAREAEFLISEEFARHADDILWRRTKAGYLMEEEERARFTEWMEERMAETHDEARA